MAQDSSLPAGQSNNQFCLNARFWLYAAFILINLTLDITATAVGFLAYQHANTDRSPNSSSSSQPAASSHIDSYHDYLFVFYWAASLALLTLGITVAFAAYDLCHQPNHPLRKSLFNRGQPSLFPFLCPRSQNRETNENNNLLNSQLT